MSPSGNSTTTDSVTPCDTDPASARSRISSQSDPELQRVIDAWPTLPSALRAGVLAMVEAASRSEGE